MTIPKPTIVTLLSKVMEDVGAVRKADRNTVQNFSFRGIDAVVNACSPALRKHGVVVVPELLTIERTTVEVGQKRSLMGHVAVTVAYTFHGPAGDSIRAVVAAESMDSGDKATPKAMSVAYRTALLQTLSLPTDEPDPDSHSYERSAAPTAEEIASAKAADAAAWAAACAEIDTCSSDEELRTVWQKYASTGALSVPNDAEGGATLNDRILARKDQLAAEALPFDRPLPEEGA